MHQGPTSVMYSNYLSADFAGTQAPLAGISNLVLKERIDKPMTHILLDGGSWNTLGARFYHQDHKGNLHYFFGTTYEQSDYKDFGAPNSWFGMLDDPSYKKMKLYGKATYFAGSRQKISVFAQHTLHDGFTGRAKVWSSWALMDPVKARCSNCWMDCIFPPRVPSRHLAIL
jgi:iron complex outermembrane recepter protein